jgi:predicted small secreted protein
MNRLIIAVAILACSGCNTVAGLGKDLQAIGGVVTGTADGVQNGATQPPAIRPCAPDDKGRLPPGCAS